MKTRLMKNIAPLVGGVLFLIALWVLHGSLKKYHYRQIVEALALISHRDVAAAMGLCVLGYLALTFYDVLGFLYVRQRLPYRKIAMTLFIGYAFSNNIGLSFLSGGSVRYRLYSGWLLSPFDIARIVVFCTVTGWVGFFGLGGAALLIEPTGFFAALRLPFGAQRFVGILFVIPVLAYLILSAIRRTPIKFRDIEFGFPPLWLALLQVVIASIDLSLAASVLYFLLPADLPLSYPAFLGIFLLAIVAGLISQVPGGVGIFETVMVVLLSPLTPASSVFASLVVFRLVYYLFPLCVATVLLSGYELYQRRAHAKRVAATVGVWFPAIVPRLFAIMTFLGGTILLFSGSMPSLHGRMTWLRDFVPLPVMEMSHFVASLSGAGLVLLARGIERKLDAAYLLSTSLLGMGIVLSLLKGFNYEEAIMLGVMLAALIPCRRHFSRKTSLFREPLSLGWIASIGLVLVCSVWLGIFSHKHTEYSQDLWWQFSFTMEGDAPRFLRAMVGGAAVVLFFALERLLHPAPPEPELPQAAELEKARGVIARSRDAAANLALLGDKELLFNDEGAAFIMYGIEGRSWVAMGDPVGPEDALANLVWRYYEMCEHHGGWTVFYQVAPEHLPLYLDLGLSLVKLGEEARVSLADFNFEGSAHKTERHVINRIEKEGYTFEIVPSEQIPGLLPSLKAVSDRWLQEKNTREKRFSLGCFNPDYLKQFPHAIVRKLQNTPTESPAALDTRQSAIRNPDSPVSPSSPSLSPFALPLSPLHPQSAIDIPQSEIVAFANLWLGGEKEELSLDLMRYTPDAPHSVMEYLFLKLMLWGQAEGYQWFNLGMAPLSGLENRALAPLWHRIGALVFRHGEHFYNFQGLRQYKEKFHPTWKPKYLAFPGGLSLPPILTNIAALISGGLKGVIAK